MSFLKKAQQQVAHTSKLPALGNQDLRQLQDVINSEKTFIQSNTRAATDFKKNAEALKAWSAEEGPDLNDVAGKISLLYDHYSASQNRLNSHLATVRLHFKSIRTREEALSNLKSRKRSLGSDIEKVEKKLAKMGPENKELTKVTTQLKEMRGEMEGLHIEVMNEEAAIGDFKRRTLREALGIKSGALLEMAEKLTIVAEISKLMLDEIPQQPTRPGMPRAEYYGFAKTESLLQEATRSIADVGFHPTGQSAGIPRFNDMTLADTTGNLSRDMDHSYANDGEVFHDMPSQGDHGEYDADPGYNPPPNRGVTNDDATRTPIYAQHAARSQWAQEGAANAAAGAGGATEVPAPDASTREWAQSSYERVGDTSTASAAAAAAMAATAGADLNAVPGHGDPNQPDGGFLMQNSQSHAGSGPNYGSNRNSGADYSSAQGGSHAPGAPTGLADVTASTEGHQSDAYDGYTAGGAGNGSATHHEASSNPTGMLGAPTLPPVRTATPLTNTGAPPVSYTAPAAAATDDSAYFQSIGSTRAMQEAVRAPLSPGGGSGARLSSYGALGGAPQGGEGKKVTAAAFRRGFSRNPSATAGTSPSTSGTPYDEGAQQPWASNPNPLPQIPNPHAGSAAHDPDSTSVPPLHIQKRLSNSHNNPLAAAAAAGTPHGMQGRRYSNEFGVSGSDHPAPPYLGEQGPAGEYGMHGYGAPTHGYHPQHMQHPAQQRQHTSQYAEYAAPPPPGYGYA